MGAWIMSVVGVICLGVLLEIVLPSGKTTKYVRGAFSLLVVYVIASIIPVVAKADWDFDSDDLFSTPDTSVSAGLNLTISASEKARLALQREGCEGMVDIEMNATVISNVRVGVQKTTISGARIVEIVAKTLNVSPKIINVIYSDLP